MIKSSLVFISALYLAGCAGPSVMLSEGGKLVQVGKSDPYDGYTELGSINAADGSGCGAFGYRGTYDRAIINLRNKAYLKGADYVQIYTLTEPHFEPGCFDNLYEVNGAVFKKGSVNLTKENKTSGLDKLIKLKTLLDNGGITQFEYDAEKGKILAGGI